MTVFDQRDGFRDARSERVHGVIGAKRAHDCGAFEQCIEALGVRMAEREARAGVAYARVGGDERALEQVGERSVARGRLGDHAGAAQQGEQHGPCRGAEDVAGEHDRRALRGWAGALCMQRAQGIRREECERRAEPVFDHLGAQAGARQ